jgi:hypothetical protein
MLLLLPVLLARSVLPSGFMWAPATDAARIIFCPDQTAIALTLRSAHAEHVHSHHHAAAQHGSSPGEHGIHSGSQCPFAVAAVAVPPAFVAGIVSTVTVFLERSSVSSTPPRGIHAPRAHPIRGPPALS